MLTPSFLRHFIWFDYDTEITSNPANSQTETSSFVSVVQKRCSSQSHRLPDPMMFFLSLSMMLSFCQMARPCFKVMFERMTIELSTLPPPTMKP